MLLHKRFWYLNFQIHKIYNSMKTRYGWRTENYTAGSKPSGQQPISTVENPDHLCPSSYLYLHEMLPLIIDQVYRPVAAHLAVDRHAPRCPRSRKRDVIECLTVMVMQAKRLPISRNTGKSAACQRPASVEAAIGSSVCIQPAAPVYQAPSASPGVQRKCIDIYGNERTTSAM